MTMGKPTFRLFSLLILILSLFSCRQSSSVTAPEDSVGSTSEATPVEPSPSASVVSPPVATEEPPLSSPSSPSGSEAPDAVTSVAEQAPRSSPVALAKKDCGELPTQQELNQCAAENYAISDKELNRVYQEVLQGLDAAGKDRLTQAEERWIVFRDAACAFESGRFEGGSIEPLIQASCMELITDNRIAALGQTLKTNVSLADVDAQLNDVYQAVQAVASEAAGETLTDVQLAWLDYRDAHCDYESNLPSTPDLKACLAAVTETRVWQLETLKEDWSL